MPAHNTKNYDVIIVGAGAAGMMCAIEAGKRGREVLLLDHAKKIGEKIRISGGGRCNFTNIYTESKHFTSLNKHFCKSALKRYQPAQIMALLDQHNIHYHEKYQGAHEEKPQDKNAPKRDLQGQLFGDESAELVVDMLLNEVNKAGVTLRNDTEIDTISKTDALYCLKTISTRYQHSTHYCAPSLIIATGGKSIPKIGATGFGYQIAQQFGHKITDTRPGLVPLTFTDDFKVALKELAGISLLAQVRLNKKIKFQDDLLFTHRGLSGPAILQISSFWREGQPLLIDLMPEGNLSEELQKLKKSHPKQELRNALAHFIPKRLALYFQETSSIGGQIAGLSNKQINKLHELIHNWEIRPNGTEGYRTAEVTTGGVETKEISSKTMESALSPGLYFVGEVLDVTGQLGGFNFQWAWASGHAAGQFC